MIPNKTIHEIPSTGFRGILNHWQNELKTAFRVSLVALPLRLSLSMALGTSTTAGIFSTIGGGLVATLFRDSHILINGPVAGLIDLLIFKTCKNGRSGEGTLVIRSLELMF